MSNTRVTDKILEKPYFSRVGIIQEIGKKISNMDFNPQNIYVLGILSIFCIKCQLDSFVGSGAVGVAALNKKRNCILIEILK